MKDVKDVVCGIQDFGLFVELARTLGKTYKKVYYSNPSWLGAFPRLQQAKIGTGFDEIEVIDDIYEKIDEIDLMVFTDVGQGWEQRYLAEKAGIAVWGCRVGEELEFLRDECKELMKSVGLPVGPYEVVKGIDNLRKYLKEHNDQFVKINKWRGIFESFRAKNYNQVEPVLDMVEHDFGALGNEQEFICEDELKDKFEAAIDCYNIDGQMPGKTLYGVEIKDEGYVATFVKYNDIPAPMRLFDEKMADILRRYKFRSFYSPEIRIGKDKVPYMIDLCFDDETEVLTKEGWKLFKICNQDDLFATLNISNKNIEYQKAFQYIEKEYDGKMIRITNRKGTIDCVLHPEHDVLRYDENKTKLYKEKAGELSNNGYIPRSGIWNGNEEEFFILPEYYKEWEWKTKKTCYFNRRTKKLEKYDGNPYKICSKEKKCSSIKIPMIDWASFMGWFISEGSTSNGYLTQISQKVYPEEVKNSLNKLPFKYTYKNNMFRISSVQLTNYLLKYGLCNEKYVPDYIKNSTPKVIRAFLDSYWLGDGCRHGKSKRYTTTSKRLANDVQELILKCGSVANIKVKKAKGTICKINKKEYVRNYDIYIITEHFKNTDFWFETGKRIKNYITEIDYSGKIYCVAVPNGTLYIRRNGKPLFSGNCTRAPSPGNEIYQVFYKNLAEIMWQGANGVCIDPIPKAKWAAESLIHSSWATDHWQPIEFPKELSEFVKLRNAVKINGKYYTMPSSGLGNLPEIGAVVGYGGTQEGAIDMVRRIAKEVEGYYVDIKVDSLERATEEIDKAREYGAWPE